MVDLCAVKVTAEDFAPATQPFDREKLAYCSHASWCTEGVKVTAEDVVSASQPFDREKLAYCSHASLCTEGFSYLGLPALCLYSDLAAHYC